MYLEGTQEKDGLHHRVFFTLRRIRTSHNFCRYVSRFITFDRAVHFRIKNKCCVRTP